MLASPTRRTTTATTTTTTPPRESETTGRRSRRLVLEWFRRRAGPLAVLAAIGLLASLYAISSEEARRFEPRDSGAEGGYLVSGGSCRIPARDPLDPSIRPLARKLKFERCPSNELARLTGLSREENGSAVVVRLEPRLAARHPSLECCCAPISRPARPAAKVDSSIAVGACERFEGEVRLPEEADAALVRCSAKPRAGERRGKLIHENVHPILRPERVSASASGSAARKLSVLLLGIDSVSRLNFLRSAPRTDSYLRETGWLRMDGYNKMGDNTFPNLMALLTGLNQSQAYSICEPSVPRALDRCPFLWASFREAGYATAYGEDESSLNTFNYLKAGFVEPPTDYYLRPYVLACEKLLKPRKRFGLRYCTGPETSFDRILDYGLEFARAFLGSASFGLFWTVSASHENANGLSAMDERLAGKLARLERDGVLNETMAVLLSDHGMRWGPIRNTRLGWYEDRLPVLYVRLPAWFREERPDAYPSLRANRHRLVSPFDLYETMRDALEWSGGRAAPAPGCPRCRSLLAGPLPPERGCADAGISSHWCACVAFAPLDPASPPARDGPRAFLDHANGLLDRYRHPATGKRLCASLRLKKLLRADRVEEFSSPTSSTLLYFYVIQVSPGDGKFEVTARHRPGHGYTVSEHEVSRLDRYAAAAACLPRGIKHYCHCLDR